MGILDIFANVSHSLELHESMDEILFGEIVTLFHKRGWPVFRMESVSLGDTMGDKQVVTFRTYGDDVLYSLKIVLDRKTGGVASLVVGNKATLTLVGEVKNFLVDPDAIIENLVTDLRNLFKIPIFGNIRVNHEHNSIFAQTTLVIEIGDFIRNRELGREKLKQTIFSNIERIKQHLRRYKKHSDIVPKY